MSELNDEILDEIDDGSVEDVTEDDIRDSLVITVPLDSTLTINGAAADAKAVGQAVNSKVSESDVKSLLSVNGRTGNGTWTIMNNGGNIPAHSDNDSESVAEALDRIGTALATETAERENASGMSIQISDSDHTKIKTYIDSANQTLNGRIDDLEAHKGFVIYVPISTSGTQTATNSLITANHYLTGVAFVNSQGNLTNDVLAELQWTTLDGSLEVIVETVYATGTAILDFGWRQRISGPQASGGET